MPCHTARRCAPSHHRFSPEARDALMGLTYRFPVMVSYILDAAGDEVAGLLQLGGDSHGVAIAYPIIGGFCAEDSGARLLGIFKTAEDLCSALTTHLVTLCTPNTIR